MVCLYCGNKTIVTNSRAQRHLNQIWRRRKCTACSSVVTTIEAANMGTSHLVRNETGELKPFSRDKLFISILNSLQHRRNPLEDAVGLTYTITRKLLDEATKGVITKTIIAHASLVALNRFDKAASVHYQAIHHILS